MNEQSQRIAIAEACGWHTIAFNTGWIKAGDRETQAMIPDYLNDLNAMHKAEQVLWETNWSHRYNFNDHLANILRGRVVNRNEWVAEILLDATARQRAAAFLRTIGKWTETTA